MLNDILDLLNRRSTPDLPLADLFLSILRGEGTRLQRSRFGRDRADLGRQVIVQVIERYAQQTQNWSLMKLLDRFRDFSAPSPILADSRRCRSHKSHHILLTKRITEALLT